MYFGKQIALRKGRYKRRYHFFQPSWYLVVMSLSFMQRLSLSKSYITLRTTMLHYVILSLWTHPKTLNKSIKNAFPLTTVLYISRPKRFYVRTIRTYVQYTAFTDINPTFRIYRFILLHAENKYILIWIHSGTMFVELY